MSADKELKTGSFEHPFKRTPRTVGSTKKWRTSSSLPPFEPGGGCATRTTKPKASRKDTKWNLYFRCQWICHVTHSQKLLNHEQEKFPAWHFATSLSPPRVTMPVCTNILMNHVRTFLSCVNNIIKLMHARWLIACNLSLTLRDAEQSQMAHYWRLI